MSYSSGSKKKGFGPICMSDASNVVEFHLTESGFLHITFWVKKEKRKKQEEQRHFALYLLGHVLECVAWRKEEGRKIIFWQFASFFFLLRRMTSKFADAFIH